MIGPRHLNGLQSFKRFAGQRGAHVLEAHWSPLIEVVERPDLIAHDSISTTVGTRIYVADLDAWLLCYPPESVERDAVLLHERAHAVRQEILGAGEWWYRYQNDRGFMWREEQRGWYLQLVHLQANDRAPAAHDVALLLSDQSNHAGSMIDFERALEWVDSVYAHEWTPCPSLD